MVRQAQHERLSEQHWVCPLFPLVFHIDIERCRECGGAMKVIACIEDPVVIRKILDHLKDKAETTARTPLPESRASPAGLFG